MKNQHRVNVRVPDEIYNNIQEICGEEGIYESASEFFRDLARRYFEQSEEKKWERLRSELAVAANAPFEDFIEIDPQESIEEFKQRVRENRKNEE